MCPTTPILRLITIFSLCLWAGFASAQQPPLELKFITFPSCQEPLEVEMIVGKDQVTKLAIPSNELSATYRIPRLNQMVLGKMGQDPEGNPKFDIWGKGNLAAGQKQIVMILRKGKALEDGFEVRAISSDPDAFGGGKLLFLNAASVPIAGVAGKQQFSLKPARHAIVQPKAERNGRLAYVEFFYQDENGKAVPFFTSWWPVHELTRGLVFFYQDPSRENRITFHSYREFLIEEEELP